jgi:hypothetical protein
MAGEPNLAFVMAVVHLNLEPFPVTTRPVLERIKNSLLLGLPQIQYAQPNDVIWVNAYGTGAVLNWTSTETPVTMNLTIYTEFLSSLSETYGVTFVVYRG